jgi:hypothetical protein
MARGGKVKSKKSDLETKLLNARKMEQEELRRAFK